VFRDAIVVAEAPLTDDVADVVDEFVLFDPILGPLGIEFELLTLLLGLGDWNEVTGQAAGCYDLVGDVLIEVEVARRLFVRRIQYRFSITTCGIAVLKHETVTDLPQALDCISIWRAPCFWRQ
jgi:hypothetical protein